MKDFPYIVVLEGREYESSILFSISLHITRKHQVPVLSPRFWWLVVGLEEMKQMERKKGGVYEPWQQGSFLY